MAIYLKFDGVNDQALAVDSAGTWPSDGVMTYEIIYTRGATALNGGIADAFCPANGRGLYLSDTTFQLYWNFGSFRSTYTLNNPVIEGEDKKLTFEFLSDKLTVNVYEDDVLHTVITSNIIIPAANSDVNIGTRIGGSSPCNALIRSIKRTVPSSAADSRHWSADDSDTSNTGQQPVLTEVLNGFDAVGVNMNTDGSDWLIMPDSETPINVNPDTVTTVSTIYTPTIAIQTDLNIVPNTVNTLSTVYQPNIDILVDININGTVVNTTSSVYSPDISILDDINVTPNIVTTTSTVYKPTITQEIDLNIVGSTLNNSSVVYRPEIFIGIDTDIAPTSVNTLSTVYTPTIEISDDVDINPNTIVNVSNVYNPTVVIYGDINIPAVLITHYSTVHRPSVSIGDDVNIQAGVASANSTVYSPEISFSNDIFAGTTTTTSVVYSPSININEDIDINGDLSSFVSNVHRPTITIGITPEITKYTIRYRALPHRLSYRNIKHTLKFRTK